MNAILVSQIVVRVRVEGRNASGSGPGRRRKEAVVEEAALDGEVYEGIERVPSERRLEGMEGTWPLRASRGRRRECSKSRRGRLRSSGRRIR